VNKQEIRRQARLKRQTLSINMRHISAKKASDLIINHAIFANSTHIACYLTQNYEFDTQFLINAIISQQKHCYLPVLDPQSQQEMIFVNYHSGDPLTPNQYQIPEPHVTEHNWINPEKLDLVLMPLVAFDDQGTRLGMGGGFYDYSLQFMLTGQHQQPLLIGLAYPCQRVAPLPRSDWDVPLHGVLTENGLTFF